MGNKYTNIDLSKYDNGYQESDEVRLAKQKQLTAENAVNNYGDFQYGKQSEYDNAMNAILNRKGFSYDLNGDALYQQYKDNYINQGKQAMMDTMGQAAAMTGGYGNSYAATVGNQTYQGYLQNLNNVIPELYQMALDRYNAEGDRLATNYNLLATDRSEARSDYESKYNKLVADRDYYGNRYDAAYNKDYAVWNDNRTHDTTQYWNEYNAGYQAEQDQIANDLASQQLKLQQDQFDWEKEQNNIESKYAGWINPDNINVNENGDLEDLDGNVIFSPNKPIGNVSTTGDVSQFKTKSGDNFDVEVAGKKYRVENHGEETDTSTTGELDKITAKSGQVVTYDGKMYVKQTTNDTTKYYRIGATSFLGLQTPGAKDLYAALNG
ncbi:MAG: hypothetical protein IJO75_01695 [Clostridia bacterium]|nr:hypothetical protein [Clostridia bacterium]